MAVVLVCENWQYTGNQIGEEADKDNHAVVVLAKDYDKHFVFDNIELVVREIQTDYMIIDHSDDNCFEIIDRAKKVKPGLIAIVHSTHLYLSEEAARRKIPFYRKHSFQELDNMFLYILENEQSRKMAQGRI